MAISRRMALCGGAALLIAGRASALSGSEAGKFVRALIDDIIDILTRATPGDPRVAEFDALLQRYGDLDAVARFVSGLAWRRMDDGQKTRFMSAFRAYAARVYAANVSLYRGQNVEIVATRDLGRRGVLVESRFLEAGGKPLSVGWLVSDRSGSTRLIDVIAADISVSVTTRERFAAMQSRHNGDIDAFIAEIESLQP